MGARPTPRRALVWLLLWLVPATLIAIPLIGATVPAGLQASSADTLVPAIAIWLAVLAVGWSLTALVVAVRNPSHHDVDEGKRQRGGL
jgi:hypothetical protein